MNIANRIEETITRADYFREGKKLADELGNRGPIRFDSQGKLSPEITDAYWHCGFYVFQGVLSAEELQDLKTDLKYVLTEHHTPRMH